jgi:DNA-binding NtrC family response regulator
VESLSLSESASASRRTSAPPQPDADLHRLNVLVVDDEPLIRWSVAQTLLDRGMGVVTAEDGRSAIASVAAVQAFDIVLLDHQLPEVANWTLLTLLRQMVPQAAIVLMMAFQTAELAAEARRRGACCVLPKPFDLADLADSIRALGESKPV